MKGHAMNKIMTTAKIALLTTTIAAGPIWAASHATHPETGDALADDQIFTYRVLDEHSSVDPQVVEDVTGAEIVRDLFEGLMNQDAEGNLVPGVATGFEANDANDVYTFTLRDNAKWSNGDPVVAGDFVYAWQRAVNPELASPYAWYMELMSIENAKEIIAGEKPIEELGVTAIDDHTLEVRLSQPLPYFATMTTHATTFPVSALGDRSAWRRMDQARKHRLERRLRADRAHAERALGARTQPDVLGQRQHHHRQDRRAGDQRRELGPDPLSWQESLTAPRCPPVSFRRMKARVSGPRRSASRVCATTTTRSTCPISGPEAFKDVNVRKALALAVDRKIIIENILAGGQPEAYTFTPAATAGFEVPDVEMADMTQAERDAKAKELIEEAGYGADNPLKFEHALQHLRRPQEDRGGA